MERYSTSSLKTKNILKLVGFSVLILGVIVSVYLVGLRTFLTPQADVEPIVIKDANGNPLPVENGVPVTNSLNVQLELNAPLPPPQ